MTAGRKRQLFPETDWSLLGRTADQLDEVRRKAIADVLASYHPIMINYVIGRFRLPRDVAEEIVQQFTTEKILVRDLLARARPTVGRFRAYLVHVLTNFVLTELGRRSREAGRRDPEYDLEKILVPPNQDDAAFDRDWVTHILEGTVEAMRQDCAARRPDVWHIFQARVLGPAYHERPAKQYKDLAADLRLATPQEVINLMTTAKRIFRRHLDAQIAAHAVGPSSVEEDLRDLVNLVAR